MSPRTTPGGSDTDDLAQQTDQGGQLEVDGPQFLHLQAGASVEQPALGDRGQARLNHPGQELDIGPAVGAAGVWAVQPQGHHFGVAGKGLHVALLRLTLRRDGSRSLGHGGQVLRIGYPETPKAGGLPWMQYNRQNSPLAACHFALAGP